MHVTERELRILHYLHTNHSTDPVHIKLEFTLNGTTASYDSLTISWNLLTFYTGDYNLSVMLSDGQAVNVPRGTLNYTFKGLNHDTCYNASVVAATGCSGVGLSASMVQCTSTHNDVHDGRERTDRCHYFQLQIPLLLCPLVSSYSRTPDYPFSCKWFGLSM